MSLSTFAFVYGSCLYIFPMTTLTTTVTIVSLFSKKLVIPVVTKTYKHITNENWRHYYLSGTKES
jgi:hypothetical protein